MGDPLVSILIYILIILAVAGVIVYIIDTIPVKDPYNRWAKLALFILVIVLLAKQLLKL